MMSNANKGETLITLKDRVHYARRHLNRDEYTEILAVPNWRRLQRIDIHSKPIPTIIPWAAKRCRASTRLKIMSKPLKPRPKYDPRRAPSKHSIIRAGTLAATASKRILDLALPKERVVYQTRRRTDSKLVKDLAEDLLQRIRTSRYQKYRIICNTLRRRSLARRRKLMVRRVLRPEEWGRHIEQMKKLAKPKSVPKAKPLFMKKWRPPSIRRMKSLALPRVRQTPPTRDARWIIPESALNYEITSRLQELSHRQTERKVLPPKMPGAVAPAALIYDPRPRILELARHLERQPGMESDVKQDAFRVSPTALKARCSRRLKALAKPRIRT